MVQLSFTVNLMSEMPPPISHFVVRMSKEMFLDTPNWAERQAAWDAMPLEEQQAHVEKARALRSASELREETVRERFRQFGRDLSQEQKDTLATLCEDAIDQCMDEEDWLNLIGEGASGE